MGWKLKSFVNKIQFFAFIMILLQIFGADYVPQREWVIDVWSSKPSYRYGRGYFHIQSMLISCISILKRENCKKYWKNDIFECKIFGKLQIKVEKKWKILENFDFWNTVWCTKENRKILIFLLQIANLQNPIIFRFFSLSVVICMNKNV